MSKKIKDDLRRWTFSTYVDGRIVSSEATVYGRNAASNKAIKELTENYERLFPDREIKIISHKHEVLSQEVIDQVRGQDSQNKILTKALEIAVDRLLIASNDTLDKAMLTKSLMLTARKELFPQYFKDEEAKIIKESMKIEEHQLGDQDEKTN